MQSPERSKRLSALGSLALGSLLVSCVPAEQYQSTLDDLGRTRDTLSHSAEDLASCRAEVDQLRDRPAPDRSAQEDELLAELEQLRRAHDRQLADFESLRERLEEMIAAGDLEVYFRRGRMIIGLPSRVLFDSGKAELSKSGEAALSKVGPVLQDLKAHRFEVAGHTDNVPVTEQIEFADNWHLSSARALTVTRFLIARGVPPQNLSAAGYGEYDPVVRNRTAKGRHRNRRIELALVPDLSILPSMIEDTAVSGSPEPG